LPIAPGAAPAAGTANPAPATLTPDQALNALKAGNRAFLAGRAVPADANGRRRLEIARAQYPIAVLVSCSDSRVPPELLFGRGLGELFIVRNAGNTIDTTAMGSLEYAVAELNVPLVVVRATSAAARLPPPSRWSSAALLIPAASAGWSSRSSLRCSTRGGRKQSRPARRVGADERQPHRQPASRVLRADGARPHQGRQA
jgi:hypothetical protein